METVFDTRKEKWEQLSVLSSTGPSSRYVWSRSMGRIWSIVVREIRKKTFDIIPLLLFPFLPNLSVYENMYVIMPGESKKVEAVANEAGLKGTTHPSHTNTFPPCLALIACYYSPLVLISEETLVHIVPKDSYLSSYSSTFSSHVINFKWVWYTRLHRANRHFFLNCGM